MADTRQILSKLGLKPAEISGVGSDSKQKNSDVTTAGIDSPEKKLTFEALSQLCMLPTEEKKFSPDKA